MSRRPSKSWFWILLALAAICFQIWREVQDGPSLSEKQTSKVFEVILNARLHDHPDNDGDSFHLAHDGQIHEFRLYFVDCPEKRKHAFNGERLGEQGRYFGGLSEAETVAVGQQAKAFTQQLLTTQPFSILTKWQRVYNSSRHYAFIVFDDDRDLSAKLIDAGLARIHTSGTMLPDGRSVTTYQNQLRVSEKIARANKTGAWRRR